MSTDDSRQAFAVMDAFRDAGGRVLDTARIYGTSEEVVGSWLRTNSADVGIEIVTKGAHPSANWSPRLSASAVMEDLELSLATLRVSSVHCYLLHRDDPGTPIADISPDPHQHRAGGQGHLRRRLELDTRPRRRAGD